ncbi:hypothetical protein M2334_001357 [Sphingobium sp. B11D3D]|nr:hypothetical protein [Sphingobium sp. B12D2B]MCW2369158.1 hypothetical protein [Sphingobium sp. B11D3D]
MQYSGLAQAAGDVCIATVVGLQARHPGELLIVNGITPGFHVLRNSTTWLRAKPFCDSLSCNGTSEALEEARNFSTKPPI